MTYRWLYKVTSTDTSIDVTAIRRLLNREVQPAILTALIHDDTPKTVIDLYGANDTVRRLINANVSTYALSYLAVSDYNDSILDSLTIEPVLVNTTITK